MKARFISVLLIASLFAYLLSFFNILHLVGINGMCDGGGLL
jgi:hypothetical protein